MTLIDLIAVLLSLAALFAYVNARWIRLPMTIGLMLISLAFSLGLIVIGLAVPAVRDRAESLVSLIDFNETVMHGMLGLLLFAGALHVDLADLKKHKWMIGFLASVGVILSTLVIGGLTWLLLRLLGLEISPLLAFLFGALISPTDPIAVLSILKQAGAPKDLEIKIAGESLFNDGIGVVIFLGLYEIATGDHGFDVVHLTELFLTEAVGGAVMGAVLGLLATRLLRGVDHPSAEILLSLAVAAGGYALAGALHVSGPIAMVIAGLWIGNHGRWGILSEPTRHRLDHFWELVDEVLNAVLFVLIGLEVLILKFTTGLLAVGLATIPVVLLARYLSVILPIALLGKRHAIHPQASKILTWGGIRGGISVALALSLPVVSRVGEESSERDIVLAITYTVVVFSIAVQGLTLGTVVRSSLSASEAAPQGN